MEGMKNERRKAGTGENEKKKDNKTNKKTNIQTNKQTTGSPVCLQRMVPVRLLTATTRYSGKL